ncbi:receptor expression-enhancing protein 5-like isoform X2 [Anneissia japonica]|uniref:receptor expression-enhancing protein 5-like isoform X2 n=1 Tax=Anneissia japonica TaxID=1529436 RepID=UPI0014256D9B|nr:receptor expression-enhancing protein 5-like isoform X2 [Anneissia japonica]
MASDTEGWRAKLEKALNDKNPVTDVLAMIEEKTKIKRIYLVLGVAGIVALWLVFGYAAAFISSFLGFVYPAYCSIKAIESTEKDDDTQWLTYWTVYSAFGMVEFFSDIFLSWFPFYYLFKMIFLIWCMAPISNNGANVLYHRIIKPLFLKHEKELEEAIDKATDFASSALDEAKEAASDQVADIAAQQMKEALKAQQTANTLEEKQEREPENLDPDHQD